MSGASFGTTRPLQPTSKGRPPAGRGAPNCPVPGKRSGYGHVGHRYKCKEKNLRGHARGTNWPALWVRFQYGVALVPNWAASEFSPNSYGVTDFGNSTRCFGFRAEKRGYEHPCQGTGFKTQTRNPYQSASAALSSQLRGRAPGTAGAACSRNRWYFYSSPFLCAFFAPQHVPRPCVRRRGAGSRLPCRRSIPLHPRKQPTLLPGKSSP